MPGAPEQLGDRRLGPGHALRRHAPHRVPLHQPQPDPRVDRAACAARGRRLDRARVRGRARGRARARSPPAARASTRRARSRAAPSRSSTRRRPRRRRVDASVRASSKNTSLNSPPPVGCTIGRTSTPGWSIGTSRNDSPWWRSDVGIGARDDEAPVRHVRERRPHLLPVDHPLVAVALGAVATLARSEPAFGSL